ncbi:MULTISPECIES: hypothetical protein [Rhizobium]|uniref:hypothetical protein n=1 Tax=Rhizobium TaxID=379 RepID=UPI000408E36D|nr:MULTISPECIES: hypothetical protein [Rhizobium]MCS0460409.1 hypothetical protein [Rhizobium favelukesii]UFS83833.1 hypothetical protein LPB79_16725 [Rhizobium sp. T136]
MSSGSSIECIVTFAHPFVLKAQMIALEAGPYRLIVDEEEIEGLRFSAFRRTRTHLEIPAIATRIGTRQRLSVSSQEIETALPKDASTGE